MSTREWGIEPYAPGRRTEVVAFMGAVQGQPTSEEEFAWEFERNPVGDLNVLLAVHANEIIGISCHNTFRMRLGDEEAMVSFPLNVLTREDFRGRGVFTTLQRASEEQAARMGAPIMLGFPNAAALPIWLGRLGWTRLDAPRLLIRPLLPGLAGRARLPKGVRLEEAKRFGPWADASWLSGGDGPVRSFVRDADYLNWRFVERPDGRYRLLTLRRGDETVGYAVTGETTKRGHRVHFLAATAMAPGFEDAASRLRAASTAEARARVTLDLEQPSEPVSSRLLHGYVRAPKRLNLIGKALDPVYAGDWLAKDPWAFRLGDLDFF